MQPQKVETSIKSITLLTDMEHDKALFKVHHADDSITSGAEFQITCVVCAVLVGQLKSHEIEVYHMHRYTTHTHGLTPSWGEKGMRFTSALAHTAHVPADPYAAYFGFVACTAFQQWQGYQQQVQTTCCISEVMYFNFKNTHQCNVSLPR